MPKREGIVTVQFTVLSAPRTKKNSPVPTPARTKDGRQFTRILPSASYRLWFKLAMQQSAFIRRQLLDSGVSLPITGLLNCRALVYREARSGDLLGYLEAIADWMQEPRQKNGRTIRQGAGIIRDDRQIIGWDGSRPLKDAVRPRVEIELQVIEEQPESGELFSAAEEEEDF